MEKILQDFDTINSQEPPRRAVIPAPLRHGICKIFMQGPGRQRGPYQDLQKIYS